MPFSTAGQFALQASNSRNQFLLGLQQLQEQLRLAREQALMQQFQQTKGIHEQKKAVDKEQSRKEVQQGIQLASMALLGLGGPIGGMAGMAGAGSTGLSAMGATGPGAVMAAAPAFDIASLFNNLGQFAPRQGMVGAL